MLLFCVVASFALAAIPAALFLQNLRLYAAPKPTDSELPPISVMIPARNEEQSIGHAIRSVLENRDVHFELLVLDDQSEDATRDVVEAIAREDQRLRLVESASLPAGWSGKQHACWILANSSQHPLMCFLDADVRLAPDALSRMASFVESKHVDLASGVPRQITITWLEQLLLPLIHFLLLSYLPIARMRRSTSKAYAAGCGQLFICRRDAYFRAGGHSAIRASLHDGITLPAAFRERGLKTDLFDATAVATCRMYSSAAQVWEGLAKNATEGIAAPSRILIFTTLLLFGHILPVFVVAAAYTSTASRSLLALAAAALVLSLLPRVISVWRFRQPLWSALLHPVGVFTLLVLQWYALIREKAGRPANWKGRSYSPIHR